MASDWERIGVELPVEDEQGRRPDEDVNGDLRAKEMVPYPGLDELEFMFDDMARVSDRRWIEAAIESLGQQKDASPNYARDFERTLSEVCARFVRGVRVDGVEYMGAEAATELVEWLEYLQAVVLMTWVRDKARLAATKKKSWKPRSG